MRHTQPECARVRNANGKRPLQTMNLRIISILLLVFPAGSALAQERIYRCGNEYTNNAQSARQRGCTVVEGGNVTVVQGPRPAPASAAPNVVTAPIGASAPRPAGDSADQRARDSDAKAILAQELKRAEARQAELQREYNNGEPEKQGSEARNYQKYLDRVAELKAAIARNESDIAGIKRELGRLR